MAKRDKQYLQPAPGTSEHLKRSIHTGVSGYRHNVRIRHPEIHERPQETPRTEQMNILGGGSGASPEPGLINVDQRCLPTSDTRCYLLDDFARSLTGGSYSPGDPWGPPTYWGANKEHSELTAHTSFEAFEDNTIPYWNLVESSIGKDNWSWVSNPGLGCGGLDFTFGGWFERSVWFKMTVPEHPADMAGILFGAIGYNGLVGLAGGTVGVDGGGDVYVATTEPTAVRHGTIVAHLAHGSSESIFVPQNLVPAEGQEIWIGIAPGWQADLGDVTCGFRWPWMDGKGNSGKGQATFSDPLATWQTWDAAADDWGKGLDSDVTGAWWDGNLPWSVAPSGGTFGMNGDALYFTVPAGSTETLTATMLGVSEFSPDDSNTDALGEPWTDEDLVRLKARWKLTTAGDVTEAGTRKLSFFWHSGRNTYKITANLGDTFNAQGVMVEDEDSSDTLVKDITEDSWMWLSLDARNPEYVRGRMWVESAMFGSGEPTAHDVEVTVADGSENPTTGNRLEVFISLGNATGADQTMLIDGIWFCGAGEDCHWVEERIGQGDGTTNTFETPQPFKPNSLWFFVDGHHVRTLPIDYNKGTFQSIDKVAAAVDSVLVARYLVDINPDGD